MSDVIEKKNENLRNFEVLFLRGDNILLINNIYKDNK